MEETLKALPLSWLSDQISYTRRKTQKEIHETINMATIDDTLLVEAEFDLAAVVVVVLVGVAVVAVPSEGEAVPVEGVVSFPALTVTASFMPPEQCPGTEHMK